MGSFVTRKTTFGRLGPMQAFVAMPRDPFACAGRWLKLPAGVAESCETRERRAFDPLEVVQEVLDLS
jgi:hypothetical protein